MGCVDVAVSFFTQIRKSGTGIAATVAIFVIAFLVVAIGFAGAVTINTTVRKPEILFEEAAAKVAARETAIGTEIGPFVFETVDVVGFRAAIRIETSFRVHDFFASLKQSAFDVRDSVERIAKIVVTESGNLCDVRLPKTVSLMATGVSERKKNDKFPNKMFHAEQNML